MTKKKATSADSSGRFFALRSGRRVKLPPIVSAVAAAAKKEKRVPRKYQGPVPVPEQWRFVEKHVPGCYAAWMRTVGISSEGMQLGVTGKPSKVVAFDSGCYRAGYVGCRCRQFADGAWAARSHRRVSCCARQALGDGAHALDCPVLAPRGESSIEEHW